MDYGGDFPPPLFHDTSLSRPARRPPPKQPDARDPEQTIPKVIVTEATVHRSPSPPLPSFAPAPLLTSFTGDGGAGGSDSSSYHSAVSGLSQASKASMSWDPSGGIILFHLNSFFLSVIKETRMNVQ